MKKPEERKSQDAAEQSSLEELEQSFSAVLVLSKSLNIPASTLNASPITNKLTVSAKPAEFVLSWFEVFFEEVCDLRVACDFVFEFDNVVAFVFED